MTIPISIIELDSLRIDEAMLVSPLGNGLFHVVKVCGFSADTTGNTITKGVSNETHTLPKRSLPERDGESR